MNEEELTNALKISINELAQEKAKKGVFEKIATVTALLSAVVAASGAAISIDASLQARDQQLVIERNQRIIEERQVSIDANQRFINENGRIGRLGSTVGWFCTTIATDETEAWKKYNACATLKNITTSKKDDGKRLECANAYVQCGKNKAWHNKKNQTDA